MALYRNIRGFGCLYVSMRFDSLLRYAIQCAATRQCLIFKQLDPFLGVPLAMIGL